MHPFLEPLEIFIIAPWKRQEWEERSDVKRIAAKLKRFTADLELLHILSYVLNRDLRVNARASFTHRPAVMRPTGLLQLFAARWVFADDFCLADLVLDELFFLDFLLIDKLGANLPISVANELPIGAKVMDLQEVEPTVLILQEVTHETV